MMTKSNTKNEISFHEYIVKIDGSVMNRNRKKIYSQRIYYKDQCGRKHSISRAKLIYQSFSGCKIGFENVIAFHDGNEENCAFENLYVIGKAEYMYQKCGGQLGKLSQEQIEEVKTLYAEGMQQKQLAVRFNCSQPLISNIVRKDEDIVKKHNDALLYGID